MKTRWSEQRIHLIGAKQYGETGYAISFIFNGITDQVAKTQSHIDNGNIYIARWIVDRSMKLWKAKYKNDKEIIGIDYERDLDEDTNKIMNIIRKRRNNST